MFSFPTMKNQPLSIANVSSIFLLFSLLLATSAVVSAGGLYDYVNPGWGNGRCKILNNGGLLKVTLDKVSGSGFESKKSYIYAKIDMQIKLVPGNSAGTVTTFYLSSKGNYHDEIDFEFLGNETGQPYTLHTNVFCQGKGKREQQFRLWFDPTTDFHTYTILWTPKHIVFLVDGIAIREFKNWQKYGIPFPTYQPMKLYASLWNADQWATRGGLVKTDWSKAPFNAYFKNYNDQNACIWYGGSATSCTSNSLLSPFKNNAWLWETLDYGAVGKMKWMQEKYMIYDYCKDRKRFPQGLPKECYLNNDANY